MSFADNQGIFEEGLELVRRLWAADDRISITASIIRSTTCASTPKPVQRPRDARRIVLQALDRACRAARLRPDRRRPFAAAMSAGGLKRVAMVIYRETCDKCRHQARTCMMCSYFIHFADNKAEDAAARARQIRYYKECAIPAFPNDPEDGAIELQLFVDNGEAGASIE